MPGKMPPELEPASAKDALGGYSLGRVSVKSGHEIATYVWEPACGLASATGVVHLLHGVFGYTLFEWLAPDAENYRNKVAGSVVSDLLDADLAVIGHDHPAHGRSSGLHAYVDSLDCMRDAAIEIAEHFKKIPELADKARFLVGMSMGGTTAIQVARRRPEMFDGFALISPAVRQPDSMFGWYGRLLKAINVPLGVFVPKLPVLKLPPSEDPQIRDAVQKDGLVYKGAMRVKVGQEFLRIYDEIDSNADDIHFKSVSIFCGLKDNIVSPAGIKGFFSRIQSRDKTFFDYCDLSHEVLREAGCGPVRADLVTWIKDRVKQE